MSFVDFCASVGANPAHPPLWTAGQRAAYQAWALARFRAHWRWLASLGHPELIRRQSGRAALLNEVKRDLARALAPPPTRPWASCPCHRQRFVSAAITPEPSEAIDDDDVALWRSRDRATRQDVPRRAAVALAYLETFAPGRA